MNFYKSADFIISTDNCPEIHDQVLKVRFPQKAEIVFESLVDLLHKRFKTDKHQFRGRPSLISLVVENAIYGKNIFSDKK